MKQAEHESIGNHRRLQVQWHITWTGTGDWMNLSEQGPTYVDIGAKDAVLRITTISQAYVVSFVSTSWPDLLKLFPPVQWDQLLDQIPDHAARQRTLFDILTARWHQPMESPCTEEPDEEESDIEAASDEAGMRPASQRHDHLMDYPSMTEPAPTSQVFQSKIPVIVETLAERIKYEELVAVGLAEGLNAAEAVRTAMEKMDPGAEPTIVKGHRKGKRRRTVSAEDRHKELLETLLQEVTDRTNVNLSPMVPAIGQLCTQDAQFRLLWHARPGPRDKAALQNHLRELLRCHNIVQEIRKAVLNTEKFKQSRLKARDHYEKNRGGALKTMTRLPSGVTTSLLPELAEEVQDLGRRPSGYERESGWPNTETQMVYPRTPGAQWTRRDTMLGWNAQILPLPVDVEHPVRIQALVLPQDFAKTGWTTDNERQTYLEWLAQVTPALPASQSCVVTWPEHQLLYHELGDSLCQLVREVITSGTATIIPGGAWQCEITEPELLRRLNHDALHVDGYHPHFVASSDGSGSGEEAGGRGPAGFGTMILEPTKITIIVGGHKSSTSGMMEMAGAYHGVAYITDQPLEEATGDALCMSDYESWTKANLDEYVAADFRGLARAPLWLAITEKLRNWRKRTGQGGRVLHRVHTRSHAEDNGHWGQNINEILDALAALGKCLVADEQLGSNWQCPDTPIPTDMETVTRALLGPATPAEMQAALKRRSTRALDTMGLRPYFVKRAGSTLLHKLVADYNEAAYKGEYPTYAPNGTIVGVHRAIPKESGGNRHLTAPETLQSIFSTIDVTRIVRALTALEKIERAQKCNIPGVSGCDENVFLFLTTLYDFHASAHHHKLPPGSVRIVLLSDISKAFDRLPLDPLLHALKDALGDIPEINRLLAKISHMYKVGRIAVTHEGYTIILEKLAGVFQGDPQSPVLFGIVMEYIRSLMPPECRSKITFKSSIDGSTMRIEIDYADDQVRVTDSTEEMRKLVTSLRNALQAMGLTWNPSKVRVFGLRIRGDFQVEVFDPLIGDGEDGLLTPIRDHEAFKVLGVHVTPRGTTTHAVNAARAKNQVVATLVANSPYPIKAKLDAHRTVINNKHDHLFFKAWLSPEAIDEMDKLARGSVRAIFQHVNIPNSGLATEQGTGNQGWRAEVLHLAGLVRRLGSRDPLVQKAALMVTRDAGPLFSTIQSNEPYITPRFFDWTESSSWEQGQYYQHIVFLPLHYATLARKWNVGIWEEENTICVSYCGMTLEDPNALLQTLTKGGECQNKKNLEQRQSTNLKKTPAPRNAISWGTAGQPDAHRRATVDLILGPHSSFSDAEAIILIRMRYNLWDTAMYRSVCSGNVISGQCGCGSIQTITHILNIPSTDTHHSPALRGIVKYRHSIGVAVLGAALRDNVNPWKIAVFEQMEEQDCDREMRVIREATIRALTQRSLNLPGQSEQHHKPDGIVARMVDGKREIIIIDATWASDDKLGMEDEILKARRNAQKALPYAQQVAERTWLTMGECFDAKGKFTTTGIEQLPVTVRDLARQLSTFHPARYSRRYHPLCLALAADPEVEVQGTPTVLTVAVGVGGWVPRHTRKSLERLVQKKDQEKLSQKLTNVSFMTAIKGYHSFQAEKALRGHPAIS